MAEQYESLVFLLSLNYLDVQYFAKAARFRGFIARFQITATIPHFVESDWQTEMAAVGSDTYYRFV